MRMTAATSQFLADSRRRGVTALACRAYAQHLRQFQEAWNCTVPVSGTETGRLCADRLGDSELETIGANDVYNYLDWLKHRPSQTRIGKLSAVTIWKHAASIRTFFKWCLRAGLIPADPSAQVAMPRKPDRLPKAIGPPQMRRLLSQPMSARDRAILSVLLDTGMREAECCALDLSDVDLEGGTLLVRHGKGAKQRLTVFEALARDALADWLAERARQRVRDPDALFVGRYGKRLTPSGFYKAVKKLAAAAGVSAEVSPYKVRHTFATEYLNEGGALQNLQALMGHTEIATTLIYTRTSTRHLVNEHARASPLNAVYSGRAKPKDLRYNG